jgi:hypothetical protein
MICVNLRVSVVQSHTGNQRHPHLRKMAQGDMKVHNSLYTKPWEKAKEKSYPRCDTQDADEEAHGNKELFAK